MPYRFLSLPLAFILDLVTGDPQWKYDPLRLLGNLIAYLERLIRKTRPSYEQSVDEEVLGRLRKKEFRDGLLEVVLVCLISFLVPFIVLRILYGIFPFIGFIAEILLCSLLLKTSSLKKESMEVYRALRAGDLTKARETVCRQAGYDIHVHDPEGITRAAVGSLTEAASDGTIAPMLFMAIGGVPLMSVCIAVNMMDNVLGHKSGLYLYYGRAAAKLDDAVNYFPSRLCGWLIVAASYLMGFDGNNSKAIYLRDRSKHDSPNSAHTEAAIAGALNISLGGEAVGEGGQKTKPLIGDPNRPIELEDIPRTIRIFYGAAILSVVIFTLLFKLLH